MLIGLGGSGGAEIKTFEITREAFVDNVLRVRMRAVVHISISVFSQNANTCQDKEKDHALANEAKNASHTSALRLAEEERQKIATQLLRFEGEFEKSKEDKNLNF